jgi:hypothetical protein
LPDTDGHGELPDLRGYDLGQASRTESISGAPQKRDLSFLMMQFLVDRGVAVSVQLRQFSVFIRVEQLIFRS